MQRFKLSFLLFFFIACMTLKSQAQEEKSSKMQKIDELIQVIGSEDKFNSFTTIGMDNLMRKYGSKLGESDRKIIEEESIKMIRAFLSEDLPKIYDKYLSEAEIDDLLTFYKSETGRRFQQMQPLITNEVNLVFVSNYSKRFQESIQQRLQERTKENNSNSTSGNN